MPDTRPNTYRNFQSAPIARSHRLFAEHDLPAASRSTKHRTPSKPARRTPTGTRPAPARPARQMSSTLVARPLSHNQPAPKPPCDSQPIPQPHQHPALKERYQVLDRLGHGVMGTVYRALDKTDRTQVAVKVVLKRNLRNELERTSVQREVALLQRISHDNIISFHHAFEDDTAVYIVTEYCEKGDLFHYLNDSDAPVPERRALKFMRQLFHAMMYLNRNGISHRDIKPENILLTASGKLKLADFGLSFCRHPKGPLESVRHCGTLQYSAPEIIGRSAYVPEQSDMWSCGILLYAMLTQSLPFNARNLQSLQREIVMADPDRIVLSGKLDHVSTGTKRLMRTMISMTPERRPLPKQAISLVDDAILGPREYRTKHIPW